MPPDEEIHKPPPRPKRRLVPDLAARPIEVGGQTLTRVARSVPDSEPDLPGDPAEVSLDGLEAIARKHLGPHAASVLSEHAGFFEALVSNEETERQPAIADIAQRLELFSDTGVVPHPESAPDKREGGQVSSLVHTEDAPDFLLGRSQPETLLDLFEMFPQLDGQNWFIYVERLEPRTHGGVPCRGVLRPLTRQLTDAEWRQFYGGGRYKLIVYGPPKRALVMNADGRVPPKKMTEPILVQYPGAPSFESMDDSEDSMTQSVDFTRGRPLTTGDARVAEKALDVDADREKRQEAETREARQEAERLRREQEKQQGVVMTQFMTAQREAADREGVLREQMLAREREFAEEQRRRDEKWEERFRSLEGTKKPDEVERLVALAKNMNKDDGSSLEALREEHAREIERLTEHRATLETTHQRALKDERDRADRLIQDERARADQRIKDAEERFHHAERELRDRSEREVSRAKEDADRRIADLNIQHNNRMSDLERTQLRELGAKDAAHQMDVQTREATWTMRLETAKGEIKRTQSDAERYRQEADANKDFVGKISQFKEQASLLGLVDQNEIERPEAEPETIGQMLLKMATQLGGNLPAMIENFATLARGKNQQQLEQARQLGRQEIVLASQREGLASGIQPLPGPHARRAPRLPPADLQPIESASQPPLIPGHEPIRRPTRAERVQPMPGTDLQPEEILRREEEERALRAEQQMRPPHPAPPSPSTPPMPPVQPPASPSQFPSQFPEARQGTLPPAPLEPSAAYEAQARERAEDLEIVQTEQILLPNYQAGASPEEIVSEIAKVYPVDQIASLLAKLGSAERVIEAYERTKDPSHPFLRREGKKFLRGIFSAFEKVARAA